MEIYLQLADWLAPNNTLSQLEAIKLAVLFCIAYGFRTSTDALYFLKSEKMKPFIYTSNEERKKYNFRLN